MLISNFSLLLVEVLPCAIALSQLNHFGLFGLLADFDCILHAKGSFGLECLNLDFKLIQLLLDFLLLALLALLLSLNGFLNDGLLSAFGRLGRLPLGCLRFGLFFLFAAAFLLFSTESGSLLLSLTLLLGFLLKSLLLFFIFLFFSRGHFLEGLGRFFVLGLLIKFVQLFLKCLFLLFECLNFLIEEVFSLFNELDHVLVARLVDGIEKWRYLAVQVEQARLLVPKLNADETHLFKFI